MKSSKSSSCQTASTAGEIPSHTKYQNNCVYEGDITTETNVEQRDSNYISRKEAIILSTPTTRKHKETKKLNELFRKLA